MQGCTAARVSSVKREGEAKAAVNEKVERRM
jgi:hypothetical protein